MFCVKGLTISPPQSRLPALCEALDGGSPMSHVNFKKWQCCMSSSFILPNVTCQI